MMEESIVDEFRRDAAWYCDGSGASYVATIEDGNRSYDIYCVGQMRLLDTRTGVVHRTKEDLIGAGLTEDADLVDSDQNPNSPFEWLNNPWFEIMDGSESTQMIEHDLLGAIELALEALVTSRV
jgi:hypothetical protein